MAGFCRPFTDDSNWISRPFCGNLKGLVANLLFLSSMAHDSDMVPVTRTCKVCRQPFLDTRSQRLRPSKTCGAKSCVAKSKDFIPEKSRQEKVCVHRD